MKTSQEFCETLAYRLGGLAERRKLPQRGQGELAPAANGFRASGTAGSDNLIRRLIQICGFLRNIIRRF